MILWDVNLWIYAFRQDSPNHAAAKEVLYTDLDGPEVVGFSPAVASSFLRIVTNREIFTQPSNSAESWDFIGFLEAHPNTRHVLFDDMAFGIFKHLSFIRGSTGNLVPDVFLAALAVRHNCTFIAYDTGFKQYAGLDLRLLSV